MKLFKAIQSSLKAIQPFLNRPALWEIREAVSSCGFERSSTVCLSLFPLCVIWQTSFIVTARLYNFSFHPGCFKVEFTDFFCSFFPLSLINFFYLFYHYCYFVSVELFPLVFFIWAQFYFISHLMLQFVTSAITLFLFFLFFFFRFRPSVRFSIGVRARKGVRRGSAGEDGGRKGAGKGPKAGTGASMFWTVNFGFLGNCLRFLFLPSTGFLLRSSVSKCMWCQGRKP